MKRTQRPVGIVGAKLDHIAFGLATLADAPATLVGLLGGRTHEGGPNVEFVGGQWEFERGARIEAIAPNDNPDSFMHRFIATRGPGVHHVTFKVPDIYRARDLAGEMGYAVTGFNDAYEAWKELFLHPKSSHGIVVQLAQTDPDIPDEGWTRDFDFPRFDGPTPDCADLLGVKLAIKDFAAADRLWSDLLGGVARVEERKRIYAWDHSPLRIAVIEDRDGEEGPRSIEVSAVRPGAVPPEGRTALGTRFERG